MVFRGPFAGTASDLPHENHQNILLVFIQRSQHLRTEIDVRPGEGLIHLFALLGQAHVNDPPILGTANSLGKMLAFQLIDNVGNGVHRHQQPIRQLPHHLRAQIAQQLDNMQFLDRHIQPRIVRAEGIVNLETIHDLSEVQTKLR